MTEILDQIQQWAHDIGATHTRIIMDRDYLQVKQSVRDSCLVNACGKSGKSWTCPPHVGELSELGDRLLSYPEVIIIQNITELEDSWDFEGMTDAQIKHNNMIRELGKRITKEYPHCEILILGCGECGFCEKCNCPDESCRFPDEALSSVEGYGLEINALVESVGLNYINGVNTVSYVGAILLRCGNS